MLFCFAFLGDIFFKNKVLKAHFAKRFSPRILIRMLYTIRWAAAFPFFCFYERVTRLFRHPYAGCLHRRRPHCIRPRIAS